MFRIYILLFLILLVRDARSQSYPFRTYTVDDGLNSNTVYDIEQDENGFIWFATNAGICRFDGQQFRRYTIDEGIADNEVLKIKSDRNKRLWLLHFNGNVSLIENGVLCSADKYPLLKKVGPGFFYTNLYHDLNDNLWLLSTRNEGLKLKFPDQMVKVPVDSQLLFQARKHDIYLTDIIKRYQGNGHLPNNYPVGSKASAWDYSGDSLLILSTDSGIMAITSEGELKRFDIDLPYNSTVLDIYSDDNTGLWISVANGGVYYYEKTKQGFVLFDQFLKDDYITSTFKDQEGNFWFSIHGGGVKMMQRNFKSVRSFTKESGLKDNEVYSICVDRSNGVWLGFKYGWMEYIKEGVFQEYRMPQAADMLGRVLNITEHPSGSLLVGGDDGMCMIEKESSKTVITPVLFKFSKPDHSFNQPVKDFTFNRSNDVFIASQEGIQFVGVKDILKKNYVATSLDFLRKRYYSVCYSDDGLYFSDFDGLGAIVDMKAVSLSMIHPLLSKRIIDICSVGDKVVVSVLGYGLVIMEKNSVKVNLTTVNGLLSNHCSKLYTFKNEIYVCTNEGLNILRFNANGTFSIDKLTTADGLISNQINDVCVKDDYIYVATLKGVSKISKGNSIVQGTPRIYITKVAWQGKDITDQVNPEIGFIDKYLRFEFISPFFTFPEGVEYQYKLNNSEWISTKNTILEFNSLNPGDYILKVRARHLNSVWSKEATYTFIILQPFYKTGWFYFLIGFLLLFSIVVVYIYRIRRIEKEQQLKVEYEQKINLLQNQALQAMVNPHFIFNSLSAIQQQINLGDSVKAGSYLSRFAKLLRKNLESINESYITLNDELERLHLYLESEKMRLEERLHYNLHLESGLNGDDILVPSMIIQPLIENAIWHGLMPKGSGMVQVLITSLKEELKIEIIDNGIGINQSTKQSSKNTDRKHFGLHITTERLKILERKLGKRVVFEIEDLAEKGSSGTIVTIIIPFIYE